MSKRLRCGAGSEWIQGKVSTEQSSLPDRATVEKLLDEYTLCVAGDMEDGMAEASDRTIAARDALLRAIFGEDVE